MRSLAPQGFENTMFPFSCLAFGVAASVLLLSVEFVARKIVGGKNSGEGKPGEGWMDRVIVE